MAYDVMALLRAYPTEWHWVTRWNGYTTCLHHAAHIKLCDCGWLLGVDVYYNDVLVRVGFWNRRRIRRAMQVAQQAAATAKIRDYLDAQANAAEARTLKLRGGA